MQSHFRRWGSVAFAVSVPMALAAGCGGGNSTGGAATEQTLAQCRDGLDNDNDTLVDCADPDCGPLAVCLGDAGGSVQVLPDGAVVSLTEETLLACQDGKDNDGDGAIDCADPGCKPLAVCSTADGGTCSCSDGLACTLDSCDVVTSACVFEPKAGSCVIDGACRAAGDKNGSQCEVCDPAANKKDWTPIVGGCSIGGLCYKKGERSPDGCSTCDPTRSVTAWTPSANAACTVGGRCYAAGERDSSGCEVCNPVLSTTNLSPASFACSIAGQCYQEGEAHPNVGCNSVTCKSAVSTSTWTVAGNECLVAGSCYAANAKSADGCSQCIPSQSKTSLTSASYTCNIGGSCYASAEKHPSPTCTQVTCDGSKSTSAWTIGNECLIAGVCRQAGDRTSNGCQECNPTASKVAWTSVTGGCNIGGSCYADGTSHPSASCTTVTCNAATSSSAWTVGGNECFIGGTCYAAGASAPGNCQVCNPALSKTAWSAAATACTIGGACYANATAHPSATCTPYSVTCNAAQSTSAWSIGGNGCVIGNQCYANGALDPTGCAKCDTAISKTSWTPQGTCTTIVMAGLNGAQQGNMGGIAGANALCAAQAQAAGYSGTWKAFLSSAAQNVKDLITGANASTIPVVNLQGQNMYANWNAAFTQGTWNSTATYLYTFNGKFVDEGQATPVTPDWSDADGWHGSLATGLVAPALHCNNWTDSTISFTGANGEWDFRSMFNSETHSCSSYLAVACVRIP